jgi:hypothetical protein
VDEITITDWTTIIKMKEGKANPLAAAVIADDTDMANKIMKARAKWGFNVNALQAKRDTSRHAWLADMARARRIRKTNGTFFHPGGQPVWQNSSLNQPAIALLVKFRSMRAQGKLRTIKHCLLCNNLNVTHGTIRHYLSHCAHGAQVAQNADEIKKLSARDMELWESLTDAKISEMCAHPQGWENLLTHALRTLDHCQLFQPYTTIFAA